MEELQKDIEKAMATSPQPVDLVKTATHWATFALNNYQGHLLKTALDISRALAEFDWAMHS